MSNDDFNSLINKIYQMQKQIEQQNEITLIEDEKVEPEIEEENFQKLLTEQDPLLEGFFEELTNALAPERYSELRDNDSPDRQEFKQEK
nr:6730_t:CDS:2 [Entrophospora candida]